MAGKRHLADGAYPLTNWVASELVLGWQRTAKPKVQKGAAKGLEDGLAAMKEVAKEQAEGTSLRHLKSTREQIAFFERMARDGKGPGSAKQREQLRKLLETLSKPS